MTLEEIIKKLEGPDVIDTPTADAILDLLRAGQAMRDKFWLDREIVIVNYDSLWAAGEAWDAAVGEKE